MKTKLRLILHFLLAVTFVGLAVGVITNPTWFIHFEEIVAIIALIFLIIESLIYCFCRKECKILSLCKAKLLRWAEIIADKLERCSKRLQTLQPKQESLDLLSPQIVEKSEYVSILKAAIDNEDVRNVAISGTYGSGKSSIIKTFEMLYPKYKCLNLSLAAFAEELEDNSKATNTADDTEESLVETGSVQMEQLEYSLAFLSLNRNLLLIPILATKKE